MNVGLELAEQVRAATEKVRTEKLAGDIEQAMLDAGELGAKVYRDQLRTDAAVERVAIYLHDSAGEPWPWDEHDDHCTRNGDCELKAHYRRDARAAIAALLGEDA